MTLSADYKPVKHQGNGSTKEFSYNFKLLDREFIAVYKEIENIITKLNSGFTFTSNDLGGIVTFAEAPLSNEYIIIAREVPADQEVPFLTSSGFDAKVIENSYDKLTALVQENKESIARSPKLPIGANVDLTLPIPNAGKALLWNGQENGFENSELNLNDIEETIQYLTNRAETGAKLSKAWADGNNDPLITPERSSKENAVISQAYANAPRNVPVPNFLSGGLNVLPNVEWSGVTNKPLINGVNLLSNVNNKLPLGDGLAYNGNVMTVVDRQRQLSNGLNTFIEESELEAKVNVPFATYSNSGVMRAEDYESLDLLRIPSYIGWNSNGYYDFKIIPQGFNPTFFQTMQICFLNSNPVDNPQLDVNGVKYDIYVAGRRPKAYELRVGDICNIFVRIGAIDMWGLDYLDVSSVSRIFKVFYPTGGLINTIPSPLALFNASFNTDYFELSSDFKTLICKKQGIISYSRKANLSNTLGTSDFILSDIYKNNTSQNQVNRFNSRTHIESYFEIPVLVGDMIQVKAYVSSGSENISYDNVMAELKYMEAR